MAASDTTVAAVASAAPGGGRANGAPDEHPGFWKRHRRAALTALGAVVMTGVLYFVVPQIAGLGPTLERLRAGDKWWLALGVLFEAISIGSEIALFRGVFSRPGNRVGWRTSYQIEMAGAAATKVLATAGAGGVALTVWALSAAGLPSPDVATGMVCFELLEYGLYAAALAVGGSGLWSGLFAGPAPIGLTLIPALLATAAIVIVLLLAFVGRPLERLLQGHAERSQGRPGRWWSRAAALPRSLHEGMRDALSTWFAAAIPRFSATLAAGALTSACCGRRFMPLATRRHRPCSSWATSWARSVTRCRYPAGSAAWREE